MRGNGLIGLDRTTAIEAKLDAVMNNMSINETRMHNAHEVGAVREGRRNNAEGYEEEELYQVEEVQYLNANKSYTLKPNPNLPTHYSPALQNHESFHMVEKHNREPDMNRITIRLILNLGFSNSNNNSSRGKAEQIIRVRKGLYPLKIICLISCQITKAFLIYMRKIFLTLKISKQTQQYFRQTLMLL